MQLATRVWLMTLLGAMAPAGCTFTSDDPLLSRGEPEEPCDPAQSGTICTIAGTGAAGHQGNLGPATAARLWLPLDAAISPGGELWIADSLNGRIEAIAVDGTIRRVVGTSPAVGDEAPWPQDGAALDARHVVLGRPTDLLFDDESLYLADRDGDRVRRVDLASMTVADHAGGGAAGYHGDGGPATRAGLERPSGLALDPAGQVVIMDQGHQVLRRVDVEGDIRRLAGRCVERDGVCAPGFAGDGGPCLAMRMAQPRGGAGGRLAYDAEGGLLFADPDNHRLRRIGLDDVVTTIAGSGVAGYGGDGGPAVAARLNHPVDVEVADDGTIYFTDTLNSCVRAIDPGGVITTVAGRCSPDPADRGFDGDGGPPEEARLDRPHGIEVDGDRLYVVDSYNHRVRLVNR